MNETTELQQALEISLSQKTSSPCRVSGLELLAGGASQQTWRLDLEVEAGDWQGKYHLILRRPLGGAIYTTALDIAQEYRVVGAAVASGVPSPRPYWLLEDILGQPAALVERLVGESIGTRVVRNPKFAATRRNLPPQMGAALAAIHAVDWQAHGLDKFLVMPVPGQTPAQARMGQIETALDEVGEAHPALEYCLRWLKRNEPPPPASLVLVHGDFRIGNVLVDEQGLVAVIDWEFTHIGDYAEDLTYVLLREWRFGQDGLQFGGVSQPEPFFAAYSQQSGLSLDPARLFYWQVMGNVWWAIGLLNQSQRHLSGEQINLEFACLGRRCAELEWEALRLVREEATLSN